MRLLLPVLLVGCATGSVTMPEGLDDFGTVRSANWLVITATEDGDVSVDHSLLASSVGNFCGKAQDAYTALVEANEERYQAYNDLSQAYYDLPPDEFAREYCRYFRTTFEGYAEATKRIMPPKSATATFNVRRVEGDQYDQTTNDEPAAGTYPANPSEQDPTEWFYAGVQLVGEGNPYDAAAEALDCDSVDSLDDLYDTQYSDGLEPLGVSEGTLTLEAAGDEAWRAEVTGGAIGEADGFEMKGKFTRCDISVSGYAYLF